MFGWSWLMPCVCCAAETGAAGFRAGEGGGGRSHAEAGQHGAELHEGLARRLLSGRRAAAAAAAAQPLPLQPAQ